MATEQRRRGVGTIRQAWARFAAMVTSAALGGFNENFFKEAAMLLAVASSKDWLQGYATIIFSLPYILLAAPCGWLADRFSKRRVMITAKTVEIFFMTAGAIGLLFENWWLMVGMAAFMAIQAAVYSPALNGSIPELFPDKYVTKANAIAKVLLMAAILMGVGAAGVAMEGQRQVHGIPSGRIVVMCIAISVTIAGLLTSLLVAKLPAADPKRKFPWEGPWGTVKELTALRKDRLLFIALWINTFIWMIGSLQIMVINKLGIDQFHFSKTITGLLVVAELVGFGIGGLISSLFVKGARWHRFMAPASLGMGIILSGMMAVPVLPHGAQLCGLLGVLVMAGLFGGIVMVPCESFIQTRPNERRKGATVAVANCLAFTGIFFSGPLANLLNACVEPTTGFAFIGGMGILGAAVIFWRLRKQ